MWIRRCRLRATYPICTTTAQLLGLTDTLYLWHLCIFGSAILPASSHDTYRSVGAPARIRRKARMRIPGSVMQKERFCPGRKMSTIVSLQRIVAIVWNQIFRTNDGRPDPILPMHPTPRPNLESIVATATSESTTDTSIARMISGYSRIFRSPCAAVEASGLPPWKCPWSSCMDNPCPLA